VAELATIVIALGGGAGIAAIVRSIGYAIDAYFKGKQGLMKASKDSLRIIIDGEKMEFDSLLS
jgi:hypothetical protein